jgi:hypothetical protein
MITKTCLICKVEKEVKEFKNCLDKCNVCYRKEYRLKNIDKIRKYNESRKQQALEYSRKYNIEHPGYSNLWYKKNFDKAAKRMQDYQATTRGIYFNCKSSAKKYGNLFNISLGDFSEWYDSTDKQCAYCTRSLQEVLSQDKLKITERLTIDRKVNQLGYVKNNLNLACYICNRTKSDFFTEEQMKKYIGPLIKENCLNENRAK